MPTLTLTDEQFDEVASLIRNSMNREYEDSLNSGKYAHPEDRACAWEHIALMAGVLAEFARAKELTDAIP